MRKIVLLVVMAAICSVLSINVYAGSENIENELRNVVTANFKALQVEDIDATMKTIHTQAPGYLQTMELSKQLFPYYDLSYKLLSFNYIATDAEYALARGVQKTEKVTGPAFRNNTVDFIYIFRQEEGVWKFWSQAVLDTDFTE